MALAETAELAVRLTLDDNKFKRTLGSMESRLSRFGTVAKRVGKGVAIGLGVGATAGVVLLGDALKKGIEALRADKVVAAQTEAVIASTGRAAGITAAQVEELANKLSILNGVQDDVVQGTENVILRFTNIGGKILPAVTQAALDMAAATGGDSAQAALKLSRALDNPIKGMTALTRIGIVFTDGETKQIKNLVKHNRLAEAQALILGKVQQKFGGVAKAQADADPGRRLNLSIERLQKSLAKSLLPTIEKVQMRLTEWFDKPETQAAVQRIGETIASLFSDQNLSTAASAIETAAKAVGGAISAFNSLPPEIKSLAIGALALNTVTGGAVGGAAEAFGKILGSGIKQIFAAQVTVVGANVTGGGLGIGEAAGAGAGASKLGKIGGAVSTASKIIVPLAVGVAISEAIKDASGQTDEQWQQTYKASLNRLGLGLGGEIKSATARQIGHIDHGTAAVKAAEASSLSAFRAGERATQAVNAKLAIANSVLAAIRRKPTKFTANTTVSVSTKVSVSYLQQQTRYKERVAKTGTLVAS